MTNILIDLQGGTETIAALTGVQERMQHARPAFRHIAEILEHGEQRQFDRLRGRYVRTGALKAALTQPDANHAIRDIHSDGAGLTFGASLWYAHFLKDQKGKSAVLVLQPTVRRQVRETLLDWILGRGQIT